MSASCLDNKRLGKQRVEVLQIMNVLMGISKGWTHHPAVIMWKGYEQALISYGVEVCDEWVRHSFNDTVKAKLLRFKALGPTLMPHWLGDEDFHRSHQSNLLRKDEVWYGRYGWEVPTYLQYIWPKGLLS
jgi:hypothetical protein